MIARDQLPEDAADWGSVDISFERLPDDSASSAPRSEDEIFEYVQMESADVDEADRARLSFLRTALVVDVEYWMWEYFEESGERCYVLLRKNADGTNILGLTEPNGLSPEQYILADYYDELYWS